jgi:hypothetical protein
MKLQSKLFITAALAVGAFSFSPSSAWAQQTDDANKPSAGQQVGDAAKKAVDKTEQAVGLEASDDPAKNAESIKGVIAQVADASLTKGGLDDVAERFCSADRDRLNQNKDALKNNSQLDGRIDQFQKDWKAKYNQDFKIPDKDAVYTGDFAMITQGDEARTASAKVDPSGAAPADTNARNFAIVMIPQSHGMAAVSVPFVHEAGGWKINIPDSVDANKLRDGVQGALTRCDDMKDKWPADVNDAYRAVSHDILIGIIGVSPDAQAQPAAGQLPADQGTAPAAPAQPGQPAQPGK